MNYLVISVELFKNLENVHISQISLQHPSLAASLLTQAGRCRADPVTISEPIRGQHLAGGDQSEARDQLRQLRPLWTTSNARP